MRALHDTPDSPGVDDAADFAHVFDLALVSLWLEDYSALLTLFAQWRAAGVTDLARYLQEDPDRVSACTACYRVLRVNQRTLDLFGADSQETLLAALDRVFSGDMRETAIRELTAIWNGQTTFDNQTVNYTLNGKRLDVLIRGRVLPGHEDTWDRVLVSLEDITERVRSERDLHHSEQYAKDLFQRSPVSLWVEDFRAVKQLLDEVRAQGIVDFPVFLRVHPEFVSRCMREIRVIDVNQQTLRLFGAQDKPDLLRQLDKVFRDDMEEPFAAQLIDLWNGRFTQEREVLNYTLQGEPLHVHMQFAILDDHLAQWDLVLVSLVDITARKKAEAYLEYLGKHDVLTGLRNRAYFVEETARLARKGPWPVAMIAVDLNGLKEANDEGGHVAGDALLRRAGEVLGKAVDAPGCAARIGGDEFVVLMPDTDEEGALGAMDNIRRVLALNNQFYPGKALSFAMGHAVCLRGGSMESTLQAADLRMYADKAHHYETHPAARRRTDTTRQAD